MPPTLTQRKQALLLRSELLRRTLELELRPFRLYADLAETGFQLARGLAGLLASRRQKKQ